MNKITFQMIEEALNAQQKKNLSLIGGGTIAGSIGGGTIGYQKAKFWLMALDQYEKELAQTKDPDKQAHLKDLINWTKKKIGNRNTYKLRRTIKGALGGGLATGALVGAVATKKPRN